MERQADEKHLFPHEDLDCFRHFYAFGNTPAEDFLQSVSVEDCRKPTILSLGCGDMRSPMLTIFNNFGFKGEKYASGFTGVRFVLNDRSASVLARNIMFLYLCTTMPDHIDTRKEWIASIWSLWYNHELQPQHKQMLEAATQKLIKYSRTWDDWFQCPLSKAVQFSSPATFAKVKAIWGNWKSYSNKNVPRIKTEREEFQMFHLLAMGSPIRSREEGLVKRASEDLRTSHLAVHSYATIESKVMEENLHYLRCGTVWAEDVLGLTKSNKNTVVNPTLFEQDVYNLHYSLTPYKGFSPSFQYTHASAEKTLGEKSSVLRFLPVADHHFESQPILANTVQQFSMWLQATASLLKGNGVSFTFDANDSVEFCYYLFHHQTENPVLFDAIYTSNLFDYISPPQLVFSTIPLLKSTGTLFTTTMKTFVSKNSEFLENCFGFSPELFPTFLGVHCIGQDGEYSSAINHRPCPHSLLPKAHSTTFPWREVKSQLLIIDNIGESKIAVNCLSKLFATVCLQNKSIENFLCVLRQFLKQVKSPTLDPIFMNALASAIKKEKDIDPYLIQLQTQCLLHGLHMHITVENDDCPVCNHQPLEDYIQQYCLPVELSQHDAKKFSIKLSSPCMTITSFAIKLVKSKLELTFYLPKYCSPQNGTLTVETITPVKKVVQLGLFSVETIIPEKNIAFQGAMESLQPSAINYIFPSVCASEVSTQALPIGCIVRHVHNGCNFETVISMNDTCLKTAKLNVEHSIDSNKLILKCESLTSTIVYPYPIRTAKVSIENNKIFVVVERKNYTFYKERSTYYINPSNELILPKFECDIDGMRLYLQAHYTIGYPTCFTNLFTYFVNGNKRNIISGKCSRRNAYVLIHDLHFSPIFGSPALSVSYCFLDEKPNSLRLELGSQIKESSEFDFKEIEDDEFSLMKEVFKYFSAITRRRFSSDENSTAVFLNSKEDFDHAVLFPLYPNHANPKFQEYMDTLFATGPVMFSAVSETPVDYTTSKSNKASTEQEPKTTNHVCSNCGKSNSLWYCSRCKTVWYCNEKCQRLHWPQHSEKCEQLSKLEAHQISCSEDYAKSETNKQSTKQETKPTSLVCSSCGKKNNSLQCCSRCKIVWYCNEKCQRLHWPKHAEECVTHK